MNQPLSRQQRSVSRADFALPLLGFGAAPVGNLYRPVSDGQAGLCLARARQAGFGYFDVAPHYGFGLAERRLGQALAGDRQVRVSSKVGRRLEPIDPADRAPVRHGFADAPDFEPVFDYSYDGVMRSFEQSLERLGRDRLDIAYAHDLGRDTHGERDRDHWRDFRDGGYRALLELKRQGAIGAIGLGVNEIAVCERALMELEVDVFLLAGRYTLLEQGALNSLLPACERRDVALVIGGPFNSGILANGVSGPGPHHYNYGPAPQTVVDRVAALEAACNEFDVPLQAAALQFPTGHPQVVSVIAGLASEREVDDAKRWMDWPIPADFWQTLVARQLIDKRAPLPQGVDR